MKSNLAADLPPDARISDEDILHNINTFLFAGSDTSSLSITWTLLLLAQHPSVQEHLRAELQSITSVPFPNLTDDEIQPLYETISHLPYLHNCVCESLRLIPPVHSSLRVATRDDVIPTTSPIHRRDGTIDKDAKHIHVSKGTFIHVAIEAFNLDKEIWGEDAWEFKSVIFLPFFFFF